MFHDREFGVPQCLLCLLHFRVLEDLHLSGAEGQCCLLVLLLLQLRVCLHGLILNCFALKSLAR